MANLPDLEELSYIADIAQDLGIARKDAISWQEIAAYSECSGINLTRWESSILRKMSQAYIDQAIKSQDPKCLAPAFFSSKTIEQTREDVDKNIRRTLSARAAK